MIILRCWKSRDVRSWEWRTIQVTERPRIVLIATFTFTDWNRLRFTARWASRPDSVRDITLNSFKDVRVRVRVRDDIPNGTTISITSFHINVASIATAILITNFLFVQKTFPLSLWLTTRTRFGTTWPIWPLTPWWFWSYTILILYPIFIDIIYILFDGFKYGFKSLKN